MPYPKDKLVSLSLQEFLEAIRLKFTRLRNHRHFLNMSQRPESCPFPFCSTSGVTVRRGFSAIFHIRKAHDGEDLPDEFVSRLRLSCCSYCQNWFQKLSQHVSQCKKRSAIVNGLTSSQQHSSSSQCQSVAPMPTQGSMSSSAPLPRNDYQTPASDETSGWQFIMGLSIDDILKMTPPQTVKCIKPKLKSQFQDCCLIPLQRIRENPMDDEAWKLLFLLPRMILCPLSRGGKSKIKDIHCIYDKFLNFQWAELVHTPAQTDTRKG